MELFHAVHRFQCSNVFIAFSRHKNITLIEYMHTHIFVSKVYIVYDGNFYIYIIIYIYVISLAPFHIPRMYALFVAGTTLHA